MRLQARAHERSSVHELIATVQGPDMAFRLYSHRERNPDDLTLVALEGLCELASKANIFAVFVAKDHLQVGRAHLGGV